MDKHHTVTPSEWPIMELLWESPKTLMELVSALSNQVGWSKSTITTMVRRMDDKGLITFHTEGRAKIFRPAVSREEVTAQETDSLLRRAYRGSIGLLVSAMADRNDLSKEDIAELYAILKEAEADMT
ncbi:MAG: BlaI/MecI/CopY family transcriptional regulator [Ruminococcaceae bacterium]|nr:BlaI/MecI/CopY family transcriptional regulator [Oscillospiraceae bacterium]MBQ3215167.1 BlaI/MecI/CopY family transcriptional regulator [Oscillospiraceae bacterium]